MATAKESPEAVTTAADTLKSIELQEIIVSGTRVGPKTAFSYKNLTETDIIMYNAGKNIPAILQNSPSIVSFSEDGVGVGNTQFRIRGSDATRINVTLNGMPLNNPETQEVIWVNLPHLAGTLQSIQIQRGVGTSTSGSAPMGASISLQTKGASSNAYGEQTTMVGSYSTFLSGSAAGTGVLSNGLSLDARYSRVFGNGYIRNGSVDHTNLYLLLSHYSDKQLISLGYMKGVQHTGITWEGVSKEQMGDPEYGRRYNPAGEYYDEAGNRHYWNNETDNYYSDILQITYIRELTGSCSLNAGLNYNHGWGYYENYRYNRKFSDFGLDPQTVEGITYKRSDFLRRRFMDNDFYMANIGLNYSKDNAGLIFGGMMSHYRGDHFGKLPWIKHNENIQEGYEWYQNLGKKLEFNIYGKAFYDLNEKISLFGDLQYRHIDYAFSGRDSDLMKLNGDFDYNFFNPKGGLFWQLDNLNQCYASLSVGQREPLRADLKDGIKGDGTTPIKAERVIDYELGYRYEKQAKVKLGANLYFMNYHNQMVQTGKLSDIGYKLMENVKRSYRAGVELEATLLLWGERVRIDANTTFSRNKIFNYTAWLDHYDNREYDNLMGQLAKEYAETDISFSPNIISSVAIGWKPVKALYLNLLNKYVSRQYMDNTSDSEKSIDPYFVSDLSVGYRFEKVSGRTIDLQCFINNLFDREYVANGWASTDSFADGSSINWIGYYPQATRNYMVRLTVSF